MKFCETSKLRKLQNLEHKMVAINYQQVWGKKNETVILICLELITKIRYTKQLWNKSLNYLQNRSGKNSPRWFTLRLYCEHTYPTSVALKSSYQPALSTFFSRTDQPPTLLDLQRHQTTTRIHHCTSCKMCGSQNQWPEVRNVEYVYCNQ